MDETNVSGMEQELTILEKKMNEGQTLPEDDKRRLKTFADTGNMRARYLYGMFLYTAEDNAQGALEIWQSLADENDPMAMAKVGDYYFHENAPENWDLAYDNYTREGSMPLSGARKTAIKDILNHGKFNKRVLIMSIFFCVISIFIMLFTSSFAIFHMNAVLRIIFIALDVLVVVQGIRRYRYNSYSSLRWMLPDLFLIWVIYLFVWLM